MNNEKTITRADGTPIPEHERHHARGIAAHWLLIRNDVSAVDRVAARERVADALDALAKLAGNGADEIANAHDSLDQIVARGPGGTEDAEPWTLAERCEVAATEALRRKVVAHEEPADVVAFVNNAFRREARCASRSEAERYAEGARYVVDLVDSRSVAVYVLPFEDKKMVREQPAAEVQRARERLGRRSE